MYDLIDSYLIFKEHAMMHTNFFFSLVVFAANSFVSDGHSVSRCVIELGMVAMVRGAVKFFLAVAVLRRATEARFEHHGRWLGPLFLAIVLLASSIRLG